MSWDPRPLNRAAYAALLERRAAVKAGTSSLCRVCNKVEPRPNPPLR